MCIDYLKIFFFDKIKIYFFLKYKFYNIIEIFYILIFNFLEISTANYLLINIQKTHIYIKIIFKMKVLMQIVIVFLLFSLINS